MTTYFDEKIQRVAESAERCAGNDAGFLENVRILESMVVHNALLCSGDREFPDDLRGEIMAAVAIDGIYCPGPLPPMDKTKNKVLALRKSILIDSLHAIFHKLADRRITARFGLWTDDPEENIKRRDRHDVRTFSSLRE